MTLAVSSSAFPHGATIPAVHTCDGRDVSPPLTWSGAPAPPAIKTFALICDDPDAPGKTFVHWVLYNLPADASGLPEGVPPVAALPDEDGRGGALQGTNDFGQAGYGGPCPPPGKPHRYFFKLYALDAALDLEPGASKRDLERAMKGHVAAEAQLIGTYGRRR
jgi:hypothetical protein